MRGEHVQEPVDGDSALRGFTVGVTAHRRSAELAGMLESRGASTLVAHAIRSERAVSDETLRAATEDLLANPPDVVIVATSFGASTWLAAADSWGLGDDVRQVLRSRRVLARGPKTSGALWA